MKNFYTKSILVFTSFMFCIFTSNAQWSTDANVDNALNALIYYPMTFCTDGHGGAIYTWTEGDCCGNYTLYVNRIDSLGFIRWGVKGISFHADTATIFVSPAPNICEDGKGGCYIAYSNNNLTGRPVFCQHFNGNGTALWSGEGKQATNNFSAQSYQTYPEMVNDNGKGVFICFYTATSDSAAGLYAQRLNFNGAKQWGNTGKRIEKAGDIRQPKIISDGKNGIAVAWTNYSFDGLGHQFQIRMNRLNHDGSSRFTTGNKKINTVEPIGFGPFFRLLLSKQKNIIITWIKDGNAVNLYSQKIDSLGNFLWGSSELTVCDTIGLKQYPDVLSDGTDGAYYVWNDGRKSGVAYGIFAQHINNAGMRKWQHQGLRIDSNARNYAPHIITDVNSGMKIFWESNPSNREYMQRLDKNGVKQISGLGTAVAAVSHNPLDYKSVLPASNNHDIIFLQNLSPANCYAKFVPLDGVLPLTLLQFTAENKGVKNIISWQTASEINADYFSVERSDDGYNFYEIAKQKSLAIAKINNYNYEDVVKSNSNTYYRLKSVDVNGEITYSKIIILHQNNNTSFQIVPNPAIKNCTIYFDAVTANNGVLKIFNANGILQKQILLSSKQVQLSLDVFFLTSGTYFCRIESGSKTFIQKLIIAK